MKRKGIKTQDCQEAISQCFSYRVEGIELPGLFIYLKHFYLCLLSFSVTLKDCQGVVQDFPLKLASFPALFWKTASSQSAVLKRTSLKSVKHNNKRQPVRNLYTSFSNCQEH